MSDGATTQRRPRTPRPEGRRIAGEHIILDRIRRIDSQGLGCFASIEGLRTSGEKGDPHDPVYSKAQTRRHVAKLRKYGHIIYAGPGRLSNGQITNTYLLPDRQYDPKRVNVDRSIVPLWSTSAAERLYGKTASAPEFPDHVRIDGYPVNRRLLSTYSKEVLKAAIARYHATPTYRDGRVEVKYPAKLLEFFCQLVVADRRKEEARLKAALARREEQRAAERAQRLGPRMVDRGAEAEAALRAFLTQHPKALAPVGEPKPQTAAHPRPQPEASAPANPWDASPRSQGPPAPL